MAVQLFTFHAYRSWMPDHPDGYTKRGEGELAPDQVMADHYAHRAKGEPAAFDAAVQRTLIEEAMNAATHQGWHLHAASTEPSHVHLLVSWRTDHDATAMRARIKSSLSRRLASESACLGTVIRLSRGGSQRRVEDREHFNRLMTEYLPDHGGVKWFEGRGWVEVPNAVPPQSAPPPPGGAPSS